MSLVTRLTVPLSAVSPAVAPTVRPLALAGLPAAAGRLMRLARRLSGGLLLAATLAACGGGGGGSEAGGGVTPPATDTAPVINAQPQALVVTAGDAAAFAVQATGTTPLSYEWRRDGVAVAGATAASYTLPAAVVGDTGASFTVRVSNAAGSVTSAAAVLTVNPAAAAPAITSPPASQSVSVGQTATFGVQASGSGVLSYQWQRSGVDIAGANAASYTTPPVTLGDNAATFSVVVGNAAGTVASASATLSVTAVATAPSISAEPLAATVNAGQTARFSIDAGGTQPLAYQWRRDGVDIAGATASSYTTPAATLADDGSRYSVAISNGAGSVASSAALLSVTALPVLPAFTAQPAAITVVQGQSATFTVQATGSAPLAYQWRKNGTLISGATGASHTTPATVLADDQASYSVTVGNAAGSVTSNAALLSVTPLNPTLADPAGPRALTVTVGSTATFATESGAFNYSWTRNSTLITGATQFSYTTPPVTLADSGTIYTVRFLRSNGTVGLRGALLTVTAAPVAPAITAQPASASVLAGASASFSVAATGTAPMSYQWRRNGVPIAGADGESYALAATTDADNGAIFSVTLTNSLGTLTSEAATLTLRSTLVAPTIQGQPANILVNPGQTGYFTVVSGARGSTPVTYQWRKNGVDIAGATGTALRTAVNQLADNGTLYTVVVSNAVGTVTSANATLGVTTQPIQPRIEESTGSQTVNVGQAATFTLVVGGTPPFTHRWTRNSVAIAGATGISYTTPPVGDIDDGSTYVGTAGNSRGSAAAPVATLTVLPPNSAVTQLAAGQVHSVALKADGTVLTWGSTLVKANASLGALNKPVRALNADGTLFTGVVAVAAGESHTLALKSDGSVWAWGRGELGDDRSSCATTSCDRLNPARVLLPDNTPLTGVQQVAAGGGASFAVRSDGTVLAWGNNSLGRLGDGTQTHRTRPVAVLDSTGALLSGVLKVSVGPLHTLALKRDGTVWAWGYNGVGEVGSGSTAQQVLRAERVTLASGVALNGVVAIAVGGSTVGSGHSLAVTADGRAMAWGAGNFGTLGNGSNANIAFPGLVVDTAGSPVTGILSASAGIQHSFLLKSDGTVLAFGANSNALLGTGSGIVNLFPIPVRNADGSVFSGANALASSDSHALVRRTDGTVWAWGWNDSGRIADGRIAGGSGFVLNPLQQPVFIP